MTPGSLKLLRILIAVQVLIAVWFVFSPDLIPSLIRDAEMQNDQPLYETLDKLIVPLAYVETLLCLTLWWPTKIASWAYIIVAAAITLLSSFAGPMILSAIDGTFSDIQGLSSGAMLCILYLNKFFSISSSGDNANA